MTSRLCLKKKWLSDFKIYDKVFMDKLILMCGVCFKIMLRNLNPSSFFQSLMMKLFCCSKDVNAEK